MHLQAQCRRRSRDDDPVPAAIAAEELFQASSIGPATAPTLRRLASLEPKTLAIMPGPTYRGDCVKALMDLADYFANRISLAV